MPDIPRIISGKIVELAVRNVVHGQPVKNTTALANPKALEQFRNRSELARQFETTGLSLFGGYATRCAPAAMRSNAPCTDAHIQRLAPEIPMDNIATSASTKLHNRPPIPAAERKRFYGKQIPREGEDGMFSQSWFPIALSEEVPTGEIIGRDFLDGRVVIYRGHDGVVRIQSAYCPHIGADLSVGTVIENRVQCAFHRWEYDENGMCVKTGAGLPPPPKACLYTFPVRERFGIIWAFNGHEPLWEMVQFEYPDEQLVSSAFMSEKYNCDPWIFASNTPDTQHVAVVHGFRFKGDDPMKSITWDDWGLRMKIDAHHQDDEDLDWEAGIYGTSTFFQQGTVDGWWLGISAGFSMPRPGTHYVFISVLVRDVETEGGKSIQERIDYGKMLLARTAAEDKPILDSIHHTVGHLTKADTALAKYFDFVRNYPRAHPSRDFIR